MVPAQPTLLMMEIKSRQEKTIGEQFCLGEGQEGLLLQHKGAAQEGVLKLAHRVSQTACLYNQKRGASRVSTPVTANASKG